LDSGDVTIRRGTGPDVVVNRATSYGLRQPRIEGRVGIAIDPAADRIVELRTSSGDVDATRASG
jgi:hypothetical protein